MKAEIEAYGLARGLTRREREIIGVLALGITRIKDIASRLSVSPNTVNNHMNSVFSKTRARSKSEVLSGLLSHLANHLDGVADGGFNARVLCVGQALQGPAADLARDGWDASWVAEREQAVALLAFGDYALLAMDESALLDGPWPTALGGRAALGQLAPRPILCASKRSLKDALALGYVDRLSAPEKLAEMASFHLAKSKDLRRRHSLARFRADQAPRGAMTLPDARWGWGGFVATAGEIDGAFAPGFAQSLKPGELFEARALRSSVEWLGDAQVAWAEGEGDARRLGLRFWPHDDGVEWRRCCAGQTPPVSYVPASI